MSKDDQQVTYTWVEGARITRVRKMTPEETESEGWERAGVALELGSGAVLFASRDEEGNGPGSLFGYIQDKADSGFRVEVP